MASPAGFTDTTRQNQVAENQQVTTNPPILSGGSSVTLQGRTYNQAAAEGLKKVWETIKNIANFVFNIVLLGLVYRLPKAILYDMPLSLAAARDGIEKARRLAPTLQKLSPLVDVLADVATQYQDPENRAAILAARKMLVDASMLYNDVANRTVIRDARNLLGAIVGHESQQTRECLAVIVHDLARYGVTDGPTDAEKARLTLASVAHRVEETQEMSIFGALRHKPTPVAQANASVRRSSRDSEGSSEDEGALTASGGASPHKAAGTSLFGGLFAGLGRKPAAPPPMDPSARLPTTPPPGGKPAAGAGGGTPIGGGGSGSAGV